MSGTNAEILPCPVEERTPALTVLYQRVPPALRPRLISDVLREASQGLVDLSGLWIARKRQCIVGALLTQALAGRAAALWAPEVSLSWGRAAIAAALIRAAVADFKTRGFCVAQALLDQSAPKQSATDLARGGLPRVTELTYLERQAALPLELDPWLPRFNWASLGPATDHEFREVLQQTYSGSLDMPELESVRSLDDILASHQAGGRFDATRWQFGRLGAEPDAGAVLLLSELPDRDAWEVTYLGLTPSARGRGLGRAVIARALELAQGLTPRLELAVDTRNHPAQRLYQATGFVPFDHRLVHLATLVSYSP